MYAVKAEAIKSDKNTLSPEKIMQIAMGFRAAKTVLTATGFGLFTFLAERPMTAAELTDVLAINSRGALDFFDALVSLGMLVKNNGLYSNSPEADYFLDKNKESYIGGVLEMADKRIYKHWDLLPEALKTGQAQFGMQDSDKDLFDQLYDDKSSLESFLKSMTGLSLRVAEVLANKFDWKKYKTFADIGCAEGVVARVIASEHQHIKGLGFDLPVVGDLFQRYIAKHGLSDRVGFCAGDFFQDKLPQAEVIIMGHILHDWDMEKKMVLIKKAYDALPQEGVFIVYEALIDDGRCSNSFGLLMSLNMLLATQGGFDYTGDDCQKWMKNAGFRSTYVEHLMGPHSMVVGIK